MNFVYYDKKTGEVESISIFEQPHNKNALFKTEQPIHFVKPKVLNGKIVEGATAQEIEAAKNPPLILDRLTKLELKRALHAIRRADVWHTLEGLLTADPLQLNEMQSNMRDWMRFGTFIDRDDSDMDALEQAFNLDRNEVFKQR